MNIIIDLLNQLNKLVALIDKFGNWEKKLVTFQVLIIL